jgi:hypothetical protein
MIKASMAKELSKNVDNNNIKLFMEWLNDRIIDAAKAGKTSISLGSWATTGTNPIRLSYTQEALVKTLLKVDGYTVEVSHGDQRDPYTSICFRW